MTSLSVVINAFAIALIVSVNGGRPHQPSYRHEFFKKASPRNMPLLKVLNESHMPLLMGVDTNTSGWLTEYIFDQQTSCSSVATATSMVSYKVNQCLTYSNSGGSITDTNGDAFGSTFFFCTAGKAYNIRYSDPYCRAPEQFSWRSVPLNTCVGSMSQYSSEPWNDDNPFDHISSSTGDLFMAQCSSTLPPMSTIAGPTLAIATYTDDACISDPVMRFTHPAGECTLGDSNSDDDGVDAEYVYNSIDRCSMGVYSRSPTCSQENLSYMYEYPTDSCTTVFENYRTYSVDDYTYSGCDDCSSGPYFFCTVQGGPSSAPAVSPTYLHTMTETKSPSTMPSRIPPSTTHPTAARTAVGIYHFSSTQVISGINISTYESDLMSHNLAMSYSVAAGLMIVGPGNIMITSVVSAATAGMSSEVALQSNAVEVTYEVNYNLASVGYPDDPIGAFTALTTILRIYVTDTGSTGFTSILQSFAASYDINSLVPATSYTVTVSSMYASGYSVIKPSNSIDGERAKQDAISDLTVAFAIVTVALIALVLYVLFKGAAVESGSSADKQGQPVVVMQEFIENPVVAAVSAPTVEIGDSQA